MRVDDLMMRLGTAIRRKMVDSRHDAAATAARLRPEHLTRTLAQARERMDLLATMIRSDFRAKKYESRFRAAVARALEAGRTEPWSVPWAATRRVMTVMDEARRQVGVVYPGE